MRTPPDDRLVVFDIGMVLLKFSFVRAARNFNRTEPGTGRPLVEAMSEPSLFVSFETGRIGGRQFYATLKERVGFRMGFRAFCDAYNDIFTPIPSNIRLLERLAREGRPTALLSNTNEIHWAHMMRRYPALRKARWPFSSNALKAVKPDPTIYRALSRRTGFPLDRMVYVDDRPDFIGAARALGVTSIHYTGERPLRRDFEELGLFAKNGRA